jgi:hypothetical protein
MKIAASDVSLVRHGGVSIAMGLFKVWFIIVVLCAIMFGVMILVEWTGLC